MRFNITSLRFCFFSFVFIHSITAWSTLPIGRFFLVEQSSVDFNSSWLRTNELTRPSGLVFWNSSKADYRVIQATIRKYSQFAKDQGHDPWLFSVDYEGGGLNLTPSGKRIPGVQRITKGLTPLAHPAWLGKSIPRFGDELCLLHGKIMGTELSSIGVNYPLALISDLAYRLFSIRSISKDPQQVIACMKAFLIGIASADSVIAVTKHFPGLGQTLGDTHDGVSISMAKDMSEIESHLLPFKELINFAKDNRLEERLSILSSHGKFPILDPNNLTSESQLILTDLLSDQLGFSGIRVSDAMWMGDYGKLSGDQLNAVYISSFIAGNDLLMIPGSKYLSAVKAFSSLSSNTQTISLTRHLENKLQQSISSIRERFMIRANESLDRLKQSQSSLRHSVDTIIDNSTPMELSSVERSRYMEILSTLGYKNLGQNTVQLP